MELLGQEKYPTSNGDYTIIVHRDNNKDRLQLDVHEVIDEQIQKDVIYTVYVPMNEEWDKPAPEYPDYPEKVAACKQSAIIHSAMKKIDPNNTADILGESPVV